MAMEFQTFPDTTPLHHSKRPSQDLSTWEGDGDSSSESIREQVASAGTISLEKALHFRGRSPAASANRAPAVQDADDDEDQDDHYYYDHSEMPSTREPSPEPIRNIATYAGEYMPHYNHVQAYPCFQDPKTVTMMYPKFLPVAPRNELPMQRLNPTTLPGDTFLMPPSMPSATQPTLASRSSNAKPEPKTSSKQRESKTTVKQQEEVRSKSTSKGKGQGSRKSNAKTRAEGVAKSDTFSNLSDEKKEALAKYIYDLMLEKEFTSPDGYLLVDVLAEVWKDMGDGATGGRIAQHRFAELLRFAPQYFELFRKGIRVTNHCGWFARKGEKMVRLIQPTSA